MHSALGMRESRGSGLLTRWLHPRHSHGVATELCPAYLGLLLHSHLRALANWTANSPTEGPGSLSQASGETVLPVFNFCLSLGH